jgi:hypothetical protein
MHYSPRLAAGVIVFKNGTIDFPSAKVVSENDEGGSQVAFGRMQATATELDDAAWALAAVV